MIISKVQYINLITVIIKKCQKPTKNDKWQLKPDESKSVEQEWRYDASNITQSGTHRHSQVPVSR